MAKTKGPKTRVTQKEVIPAVVYYCNLLWEQGARRLPIAAPYKTIFHIIYPDVVWKSVYAKILGKGFVQWEKDNNTVVDKLLPTLRPNMRKEAGWNSHWSSVFTKEEQEAALEVMPEEEITGSVEFLEYMKVLLQRPHEVTVRSRERMEVLSDRADLIIERLNDQIAELGRTAHLREPQAV